MKDKTIKDIINNNKSLKSQLEDSEIDLKRCKFVMHRRLLSEQFYERCLVNYTRDDKTINQSFYIKEDTLPYRYAGEGDYYSIDFKLDGNRVNILYNVSFRSDMCCHIISIPYRLFNEGSEKELTEHLDRVVEERNQKRLRHLEGVKLRKKQQLEQEIKDLDK